MRLLAALLLFLTVADAASAAVVFLGPTPYLSKADSPFPVDGSNPNFYLEDFEDGELNTPGIYQPLQPPFGTIFHGVVVPPSEGTDSVDGDDGLIDGWGREGHSLRSNYEIVIDTIPRSQHFSVTFEFDHAVLGEFPTAFGIVWTDGPHNSAFGIHITTPQGDSFWSDISRGVGDTERFGATDEDFFVGVLATEGIARVILRGSYVGEAPSAFAFEIDHLQYGYAAIPEPASALTALLALSLVVGGGRLVKVGQATRRSAG
jgi:hypothetical protein